MKKYNIALLLFFTLSFFSLLKPCSIHAQSKSPHDTSYYTTYPNKLTTRIFISQKYVHFTFPASGNVQDIEYKANTKINMGIGITWHNFSANLFYGFGFLNKDSAKGKSTGLDLQIHLYPRKWAIDLLIVSPKGFYIDPKGYGASNSNSYYSRRDIKYNLIGLSVYRVPNKEKFSYRAAITQNEWQIKSAGSLLYGGEIHYGSIKGDSALVPKSIQSGFPQAGIKNINFISVGPGIGYAHTLVIDRHFFITVSLVGNLDVNLFSEEGTNGKHKKTSAGPTVVYKAATGYNSSNWNISANFTGNASWLKGASSTQSYYLPTGAFRVVVAKRFEIKKHHGV